MSRREFVLWGKSTDTPRPNLYMRIVRGSARECRNEQRVRIGSAFWSHLLVLPAGETPNMLGVGR